MELTALPSVNYQSFCISVALIASLILFILYAKSTSTSNKRPPGPKGWPVFGYMFNLGNLPHLALYRLRSKYGPVLLLRLGSINTMVVQNASAAAELFKKHDLSFGNRHIPDVFTALDYNEGSIGLNDCQGRYHRVMRKLWAVEVTSRVEDTAEIRRRIVGNMVRWIEEESATSRDRGGSGEVKLSLFLFLMAFNILGNLVMSRDLCGTEDPRGREFFEAMNKVFDLGGAPNIADFFPFLKRLDPFRVKKRMIEEMTKAMKISSSFVNQRLREREVAMPNTRKVDFLDALLEYEGNEKDGLDKITEKNINIVIMEIFFAGSETTSISIEWGFVELLRNPDVLRKLRQEIDRVVGLDRNVNEGDLNNLPYLQAVVKETFRLHPTLPLLFPRTTTEDTNFMGYVIPKGTQVFVNVWAIGRDPDTWEDPESFKPERFLDSSVEYKGQHFVLLPFGSGRRVCIGISVAQRVVSLTLATLFHSFDWEVPTGVTLDMDETLGVSLRKKKPVVVIPRNRLHVK